MTVCDVRELGHRRNGTLDVDTRTDMTVSTIVALRTDRPVRTVVTNRPWTTRGTLNSGRPILALIAPNADTLIDPYATRVEEQFCVPLMENLIAFSPSTSRCQRRDRRHRRRMAPHGATRSDRSLDSLPTSRSFRTDKRHAVICPTRTCVVVQLPRRRQEDLIAHQPATTRSMSWWHDVSG